MKSDDPNPPNIHAEHYAGVCPDIRLQNRPIRLAGLFP